MKDTEYLQIDEPTLLKAPQPYTRDELVLLWDIYKHTASGCIGNDPLFFLTDDPTYFKHGMESPSTGIHPEFDPDIYKQAIYDVLFTEKHYRLYHTSPNMRRHFETAAVLLYVLPISAMLLCLSRETYWEIALWRLKVEK
jgi:hypothetical protein